MISVEACYIWAPSADFAAASRGGGGGGGRGGESVKGGLASETKSQEMMDQQLPVWQRAHSRWPAGHRAAAPGPGSSQRHLQIALPRAATLHLSLRLGQHAQEALRLRWRSLHSHELISGRRRRESMEHCMMICNANAKIFGQHSSKCTGGNCFKATQP